MVFKVGLSHDLLDGNGVPSFGEAALKVLDRNPDIQWEYLTPGLTQIPASIAAAYDGLYVNTPLVTAETVAGEDRRVKIVARHGVGYDSVDVPALTAKGVMLTNTPVAVRRPVAVAAVTLITALAGRLFTKDRITRNKGWDDRTLHMGLGLKDRVLTVVGGGSIGQEILRMMAPFEMQMQVVDPHVPADVFAALNAQPVELKAGLANADFVVMACLLNEQTHHLINQDALSAMKPEAFVVNLARGPVVDEAALIKALQTKQIAGAALDVFEQEPIAPDNPLIDMDNVILTPHALCWTDQCFHDIAAHGLGSIVDFSQGKQPEHVVNPQVI